MRKEYIDYIKDLPINIYLANIVEYPIHWHDAIEILFVLKGSIDLRIETDVYRVEEREIEIINTNEVHSIKSKDKDNLVLIFNIDPNFFEQYYDDAKEIFFYTNSDIEGIQEEEKYYIFRKYLSILFYEIVSKHDDYEDMIEDNLLELMYHLLNNFHYLFYEEESLREDEVQLERYHRIVKYISNNYMNKVSLQDLAKQEFLTSQYLSYKIKNTFGHSFNDFLNLVRVEESTKLLLDTDKNISEIADEVGFSHVRYYNKHFKIHYKCTPMQYRKKHKVDDETLENMKKIRYFDLVDAMPYLTQYLEEYERYNYDDKIIKLDIDFEKKVEGYFNRPDTIDLGEANLLLEEENKNILREIQREIKFKYGILNNLFSIDMGIISCKEDVFVNWNKVERVLIFLKEIKLIPVILINNIDKNILEQFHKHFSNIFGESEVDEWVVGNKKDVSKQLNIGFLNINFNKLYDRLAIVPYIFNNYIKKDIRFTFNAKDDFHREAIITNDTFFGDKGIVTSNNLKKPSYYSYLFLSKLGEYVIYKDEGYLVTKKEEDFQILLYYPSEVEESDLLDEKSPEKAKERKTSINIINMNGDYRITKYELNKKFGSIYDKWLHLGMPKRLNKEYLELLRKNVHPNITFYYGKKSTVYNLVTSIKDSGAVLYTFEKVQNKDI